MALAPHLPADTGSATEPAPSYTEGACAPDRAPARCGPGRLVFRPPVGEGPWSFAAPGDLPRVSADEARAWFDPGSLVALRPDRAALGSLVDAWCAEDGARGHASAVTWLRTLPDVLAISLVRREREGGRRYAFHIPGYRGPVVVSERRFRELGRRPRHLLPAIPRRVRPAFSAPPGHCYIVIDINRCFLVLLATVANDDALLAAAAGDFHQQAGDAMAPHLTPTQRRRVGKLFNNAVVGMITPHGLQEALRRAGIATTPQQAAQLHDRWWASFVAARRLRDAWIAGQKHLAEEGRPLAIRYPDGRTYTFDAATVRGAAPRPRWAHLRSPSQRLDAATRTTFSALWRGVEGTIIDQWLRLLHPLRRQGLRLVLPMYDGLLLQAPTPVASHLAQSAHAALRRALTDVGVPATATCTIQAAWAPPIRS